MTICCPYCEEKIYYLAERYETYVYHSSLDGNELYTYENGFTGYCCPCCYVFLFDDKDLNIVDVVKKIHYDTMSQEEFNKLCE